MKSSRHIPMGSEEQPSFITATSGTRVMATQVQIRSICFLFTCAHNKLLLQSYVTGASENHTQVSKSDQSDATHLPPAPQRVKTRASVKNTPSVSTEDQMRGERRIVQDQGGRIRQLGPHCLMNE